MTDFRGVEKEALADSFIRASRFLHHLKPGAATWAILYTWARNDVAQEIGQAKDNRDLAEAMRKTRALPLLTLYRDIFSFHAAAEAADGDSREMQDLYRDLMAWSAFFDETAPSDSSIEQEVRTHIITRLLGRLAESEREPVVREGDKKLADWVEMAIPVYRLLYDDGQLSRMQDLIAGASAAQDSCLRKTLYGICGLNPVPDVPQAMELYKVTMTNRKNDVAMPMREWMDHVRDVRQKLGLAMLPFLHAAQFGKMEILPATSERDTYGISFYGTLRAAQTAAARLESYNYRVIDPQGRPVEVPRALLPRPASPEPDGP